MSGGAITNPLPPGPSPASAIDATRRIPVPVCSHCPDCPRSALHVLPPRTPGPARAFCSPCLVALDDWMASEDIAAGDESGGAAMPAASALLAHIERELAPIASVTAREAKQGDACTLEQLRAMHVYGWTDQFAETLAPADPDEQLRFWPSRAALYLERGGAWSGESDFGMDHRMHDRGQQCCRWRVSVIATTGDTYAVTDCGCGATPAVALLGSVSPDPLYLDAEQRFAGWADSTGRPLRWFRERLARPHPVQSPPPPRQQPPRQRPLPAG